jgi:hypothetical protein
MRGSYAPLPLPPGEEMAPRSGAEARVLGVQAAEPCRLAASRGIVARAVPY